MVETVRTGANPHRAWRLVGNRPEVFVPGAVPWLPRQELPESFQLSGAVYAVRIAALMRSAISLLTGEVGAVVVPAERSIDIDDAMDFAIAEVLLTRAMSMTGDGKEGTQPGQTRGCVG